MTILEVGRIDGIRYLKIDTKMVRFPECIQVYLRHKDSGYDFKFYGAVGRYRKYSARKTVMQSYLQLIECITDEETIYDVAIRPSSLGRHFTHLGCVLPPLVRVKKSRSGHCLIFTDPYTYRTTSISTRDVDPKAFLQSEPYRRAKRISDEYMNEIKSKYLSYDDIRDSISTVDDHFVKEYNVTLFADRPNGNMNKEHR